MRKALIRTSVALVLAAGLGGGINLAKADAAPALVPCHYDFLVHGQVCLLDNGHGNNQLVVLSDLLLNAQAEQHGGFDGGVTQVITIVPAIGGAVVDNHYNDEGSRGTDAVVGLNDRPGSDNTTFVAATIANTAGEPDFGDISITRVEPDDGDNTTAIHFENGDCHIQQNGVDVAPCIVRVVPQLPFVPVLWLP